MPAQLREKLAASVASPPPLVVCFFPLSATEWSLLPRHSLVPYDSDAARASRRGTFAALMKKGKAAGLARFAKACTEADTQWLPLTGGDARRAWLQCGECSKWRSTPAELAWPAKRPFSCADATWAPPERARCGAEEEAMADVEVVEGEGGEEEEEEEEPAAAAAAVAATVVAGGGAASGGSSSSRSGGGGGGVFFGGDPLDADTEPEDEPPPKRRAFSL